MDLDEIKVDIEMLKLAIKLETITPKKEKLQRELEEKHSSC